LPGKDRLSDLNIGETNASFQHMGNTEERRDSLNNSAKGVESSLQHSARILLLIPSGPAALPKGKCFRTREISSCVSKRIQYSMYKVHCAGKLPKFALVHFKVFDL
jgi:hypothetical protein